MNDSAQTQQPAYIIPPPSAPNWKTPLLVIILVALAASNIYLFTQLRRERADTHAEMVKLNADFTRTVEQLRIDSSASVQRSRDTIGQLERQLRLQRLAAERAVGQAKVDAQKRVDQLQQRVSDEEVKQQQAIAEVKQTADTATKNLTTVTSDVQNTRSELEQTVANLKRVTGDVDQHGSLIATNAKELAALRSLGERNYFDFTIPKSKEPQHVSDVAIQLRKADVKRNRFTIEVTADDRKVEKKDRTVNEPIQFYTSKARQPYEIVVNQIKKDTIIGYLATPKVQNAR